MSAQLRRMRRERLKHLPVEQQKEILSRIAARHARLMVSSYTLPAGLYAVVALAIALVGIVVAVKQL